MKHVANNIRDSPLAIPVSRCGLGNFPPTRYICTS
jgi:hypothetical protein